MKPLTECIGKAQLGELLGAPRGVLERLLNKKYYSELQKLDYKIHSKLVTPRVGNYVLWECGKLDNPYKK